MKTKFNGILTLLLAFVVQMTFAQEKTISGTVSDENGMPLPTATVIIQGTSTGTSTDFDGNYSLNAKSGDVLIFSYVGYANQSVTVGSSNKIDISLLPDNTLDEVVVTALGIKREKKSLGYATQEVKGDAVSTVKSQNFVNSLSGKVAGLEIKSSGTLGGSTNVVVRGSNSISGNNQALFVIDGVPVSNQNTNTSDQVSGRGGYDYGNASSDINPDDIESINILKGAAATALYGSRGMHGAVIITTKKGNTKKGIGVTVSSSAMFGRADKETLPTYQDKYGAGYGAYYDSPDGYFNYEDINGDSVMDLVTPTTEDASYGAAFDPNLLVYQWDALFPQLPTYGQARPWLAGKNDPNYVWGTSGTFVNSVSLDGSDEKSSFRLGYTNMMQEGNLPNSEIKRNSITFNGSHELTDKLTASTTFTYTKVSGKGRYGTGYDSNNVMQQFRQWWQTNVDLEAQKNAYFATRENITWNTSSSTDLSPIYSDNPYWTFFENYETDSRNRYFGNVTLDYEINDWINLMGRFTYDTFTELQEERTNVGSANVSSYSRFNNQVAEYNYDLFINFNRDLTDKLNLDGNIGFNLRRQSWNSIRARTNGGLGIPKLYALSNSKNPINPPNEYEAIKMVDGAFARASLGYDGYAFLEGTYRRDRSSTLPKDNNTYGYYSLSGSFVFSEFIDQDWISFGKVRANYAEVGDDTGPYRVYNTYGIAPPFDGSGVASNSSSLNNLNLKPQRQKSYEFGLDMSFLNKRAGFDVAYYNTRTEDQIVNVPYSSSTGYTSRWLNAGTIENKGIELQVFGTPVKTEDLSWNISVNWAKNESEVVELAEGIENLQLASLQGGISINATPGEAYGTIRGNDFVYHDNGQKIVNSNGYYATTSNSNAVIGNITPDWKAGISNAVSYKNLSLNFLIDIQKGGDVFSLDTWYGYATGLYDFTAGTNDLGNPVRNPVTGGADSGGVILEGVQADGTPNTVRASATSYANPWGYVRTPNAAHVYDASYVKLREMSLAYKLGDKVLAKLPFTNASVSLIGRNLWIIHKNVPFADPEAGLSSGNIQGYQSGSYPSIREIGASLKLQF
ncbi:TonB-linked SusC/RagA family outer membrane protein [Oceanihabitans sediminis]|uniref:SusC/RagA family TonB-linked outer membrane protein n=1 Tax=Oceanihabitans sediminis TaxID=1812012 RepID=A0A368P938_9FLAO|nr:SusC/RagA family TonB-linked outer membrane protein [Oceanihabitans sediminis]RBP32182.1 TonB-linked SusC/RagA family outer membrane protein [Oceanihabitans sediminis]RCU58830.1 SusC/RagA family TonB-linked outer membrane protein [Oceanihabitans sediminis]